VTTTRSRGAEGALGPLGDACYAVASAPTLDEALGRLEGGIRALVGRDRVRVSLVLPDRTSRLEIVAGDGPGAGHPSSEESARRTAYRTGCYGYVDRAGRGKRIAFFPLVIGADVFGLLEVEGPRRELEGAAPSIAALACQLAGRLAADDGPRPGARTERGDGGLGWAAHELVGPVLAVKAALDTVASRDETDPLVQLSALELERVVANAKGILGLAAGTSGPDRRPVDVVDVVEDVVSASRLQDPDGRVVLMAPGSAVAPIDPTFLRISVGNLVRNALLYSEEGEVLVEVADEGGEVRVSVTDGGPGIRPSERAAIFQEFSRGAASSGRPGSGLGLFITRRLVEALGGRIVVDLGDRGVAFHISLPREGRSLQRSAS
jgi:two-component system sensor histidine kinase KdpD